MMLFEIEHRTHYYYDEPVGAAGQYIRLTPSSGSSQTVHEWSVAASGPLRAWRDSNGNICHYRSINTPLHDLSIIAKGVVETLVYDGIYRDTPAGSPPSSGFLRATAYTKSDATLEAFAVRHAQAMREDLAAGLISLMHDIREAVDYRTHTTHVLTTAAEALNNGEGVCQDHAHVLIAVCRLLNVPARYVSGYLYTGNNDDIHAASHAWAEAFIPGEGWLNLDVANACLADERYVRLACGLDYAGAAPVLGMRGGGGQETMEITLTMRTIDAQQYMQRKAPGSMPRPQSAAHGTAANVPQQ
jgi:transglutaminase-like putative cysteine protease